MLNKQSTGKQKLHCDNRIVSASWETCSLAAGICQKAARDHDLAPISQLGNVQGNWGMLKQMLR